MIRTQVLFWDMEIPVAIDKQVLKIDKIVCKTESNKSEKLDRASGSLLEESGTVNVRVSSDSKKYHDNKEIHCDNKKKTYCKEKKICATEHDPEN